MNSFSQFYKKLIGNYQCFGVAPRFFTLALREPVSIKDKLVSWFPIAFCLALYWGNLIFSLLMRNSQADLISQMSNYIQLVLNAIAFTVVLVSSVWKRDAFNGILDEFDRIDHQFQSLGIYINYKRQKRIFYVMLVLYGLAIAYVNVYEAYVSGAMTGTLPMLYWLSHAIPSMVYGFCLEQAIVLIYCILIRCQMVSDLLQKRRSSQRNIMVTKDHYPSPSSMAMVRGNDETIKMVYQLIDGIHELCERVNSYFGLSFVCTLLAMFAVTSIQAFYCYKIASDFNEEFNRTYWTLFLAVNLVVLNSIMVSVLAYTAERVTNEAASINNRVRKLENDQVIQYSSWLHPVLINIKISAFGFFNINLTMLCAYMSALITYMLILVQCNEIAGKKNTSTEIFSGPSYKVTTSSSRNVDLMG